LNQLIFKFHYKPIRIGKYLITIKNAGKHIQGSPFVCRVYGSCKFFKGISFSKDNILDKLHRNQTTSYDGLVPIQSSLNRVSSHVDLDILRSSMTGDASQICVFGTGLYEAKKQRKTTFKIDASQAGLKLAN